MNQPATPSASPRDVRTSRLLLELALYAGVLALLAAWLPQ